LRAFFWYVNCCGGLDHLHLLACDGWHHRFWSFGSELTIMIVTAAAGTAAAQQELWQFCKSSRDNRWLAIPSPSDLRHKKCHTVSIVSLPALCLWVLGSSKLKECNQLAEVLCKFCQRST
jgi:hypothetical protein